MTKLYFGYGSNLHEDHLRQWTEARGMRWTGKFVGLGHLPDHYLAFNYRSMSWNGGALNLEFKLGVQMTGALFELEDSDWTVLDRKEGVGGGYYRRQPVGVWRGGQFVKAETYLVVPERKVPFCRPSSEYSLLVKEAYRFLGIPSGELRRAAQGEEPPEAESGLFVYGTLLRGERLDDLLPKEDLLSCQPATARGSLHDQGDYPALLVADPGMGCKVVGEFLRLRNPKATLDLLDRTEGNGWLYQRRLDLVQTSSGFQEWAWIYYFLGEPGPLISRGDWREHCGVAPPDLEDWPGPDHTS